jgi:hypothetical protein
MARRSWAQRPWRRRTVRSCSSTPRCRFVIGQPVRIGVSGVEIEAVIASVEGGVLTVAIKRTAAKATAATARGEKTTRKKRTG